VPGWTDGSNAWRASLYSISSRPQHPFYPEYSSKASESFSPSPHHSPRAPRASCSSGLRSAQAPPSQRSLSDDMLSKFSQSFQRRSVSRPSPHPSTPTLSSPSDSQSVSRSLPKRERTLLPPAVQGKLLVPDVRLKIHSGSSASLSSTWSGPTSTCSARSPLSVTSESDEERSTDSASSLPVYRKRPTVETRSWSYDNFRTYPVMQLPPKKVKQIQKQIVDGQECEVEVEVEVVEERKCLFKFAPSIQVSQWFLGLPLSLLGLCLLLSHGIPIVLSLQFNHHTTIVIHTTQHHYQSLTTPNDVTLLFATKCSIIIPFNCHTLDLFFLPPLRFRHSAPPHDFTGYGEAFPGRILLLCQPTFVYARDIPIRRMRKKSGCTTWKASLYSFTCVGIFILLFVIFFFFFFESMNNLYLIAQHFFCNIYNILFYSFFLLSLQIYH